MFHLGQFLELYAPSLFILSGDARGVKFPLDQRCIVIGQGPGVDLALRDSTMLREHAVVEFRGGCFRIQTLGNGGSLRVNGIEVPLAELESGTRIELGTQRLLFELKDKSLTPGLNTPSSVPM